MDTKAWSLRVCESMAIRIMGKTVFSLKSNASTHKTYLLRRMRGNALVEQLCVDYTCSTHFYIHIFFETIQLIYW